MNIYTEDTSIIEIAHTNCDVPITFTVSLPGDELLYVTVSDDSLYVTLCEFNVIEGDVESSLVEETEIATFEKTFEELADMIREDN